MRGWGGSWSWALNSALDFNTEAESIQTGTKTSMREQSSPRKSKSFKWSLTYDMWGFGERKMSVKHRLPQDVRGS